MKHFKQSFILLTLLTVIISSRTFAQGFSVLDLFNGNQFAGREKEIVLDNEYTSNGYEEGNFYNNPLMLDGEALDYNLFSLTSEGELTVIKGAPVTGRTTEVPFYVYLRRDGDNILIPGKETPDIKQTRIDISEILKYAQPGDHLVIEPVRKEDGPTKRILKLLKGGC